MAKDVYKFPINSVRMRERPRMPMIFTERSRTKQEFKDECDINMIMKRYKATGLFPQFPGQEPRYVSNIGMPDYQEALNIVRTAEAEFASVNSEIRKRFDNDPAKFLAFINDPQNADELVKLGLREPPPAAPKPVQVEVVNQPAQDGAEQG